MPELFRDTETAVGIARVAVERAVDRYPDGLSYAIPRELKSLRPGQRVHVPLGSGNRLVRGYVIERLPMEAADVEQQRLKYIERVDENVPRLPRQLIELARWISGYYCAPIGITLASVLPSAVKRNVGAITKVLIDLGDPLPLEGKLPAKQAAILDVLANLPPERRPIDINDLAEKAGAKTTGPIKRLAEQKLVDVVRRSAIEAAWIEQAIDTRVPEQLTRPQQRIIDDITATIDNGFSTHLLYGVTGSGKTEVYIRLIERVLAKGHTAIMLVPEIALTPQTGGRLVGRLAKHRVAILHSGLTAAQRNQQWSLAADGRAGVVLGARSAVFAPVPDDSLGLIIVDEEHDGSYKQDQAPRYHGRDVAIRRAQLAGCPILLGSATPSLESWKNATSPEETQRRVWHLHTLTDRVPGARLPRVRILDFAEQRRAHQDRKHVHLIGPVLEESIRNTLAASGQVLILLNRRGYANYICCPDHTCGWVMTCNDCDVTMVYHRTPESLRANATNRTIGWVQCHHCLAEQRLPKTCPECGKHVSTFGLGTQRVEVELARKFPQLVEGSTMLRIDSDTMHTARDFHRALGRFGAGEIDLLLGTQMIAKGLDFPNLRLVGVINADTAINLPDFRATERTFQLVNQVAGRCGRSEHPGTVIVQTFNPDVPAIRLAAEHDYPAFARLEMAERRSCWLPPWTRMARIVVRDADYVRCASRSEKLASHLQQIAGEEVHLRGPAPCPIARIAGRYRQQIELIAPRAHQLQRLLATARSTSLIRSDADMVVDVDPIALL